MSCWPQLSILQPCQLSPVVRNTSFGALRTRVRSNVARISELGDPLEWYSGGDVPVVELPNHKGHNGASLNTQTCAMPVQTLNLMPVR